MSIVTDTFSVSTAHPDFVLIEYASVMDTAAGLLDEKALLWFERASLSKLVEALSTLLATHESPAISAVSGDDCLKVYESGPEQAPYVNVENERPLDALHGGFHWFAMSKPLAEKLASELARLHV